MGGNLVADLALPPPVWLFLAFLGTISFYFKFARFWSIRNLDLMLLFAPAPGLILLVESGPTHPWIGYVLLLLGLFLWLIRCLLDLVLTRRPLLEPNLDRAGLACLALGLLGLLLAETARLPSRDAINRNPADPHAAPGGAIDPDRRLNEALDQVPMPVVVRRTIGKLLITRLLAAAAHLGLVVGLLTMGSRHFERATTGLAVVTAYLISPYTRIALIDGGQLVAAALVVGALASYRRPSMAGAFLGLASGWMPACLGLLPLWAGFYRRRGAFRFAGISLAIVATCGILTATIPPLADWSRDLGARSLVQAGLLPNSDAPAAGSLWSRIDPSFRLPVLLLYFVLVTVVSIWPAEKNLGELIALSAAILVASQFWYLDEGGTHVLLSLPLVLLMMFRPNLAQKRPVPYPARATPTQAVAVAST